ncbi:hypothetical protein Syun_007457 [Stephania yunnanensis]|uniref:Uncharacterized protein n=1 Tax=Stephania yunnanensis TaxID=152371 RepID=A0AAP0KYS8_9MAGN
MEKQRYKRSLSSMKGKILQSYSKLSNSKQSYHMHNIHYNRQHGDQQCGNEECHLINSPLYRRSIFLARIALIWK